MTANVEGMINAAVNAFKSGNKSEARTLLERAIEIEEMNEKAWLWLSAVVDTPEEQQTCLENVLVINPNNERAKQGLLSLGVNPDPSPLPADEDPPTATSVQWASDAPAAPPPTDEIPPTASSSASSSFQGQDVSKEEYDDWLDGLNIGGSPAATDDPGAANIANTLAGAGFSQSEFESELDAMFGSEDDDGNDYEDYQPAGVGIITGTDDEDMMTSGPFDTGGLFDDMEFDGEATTAPTPPPTSAPLMSPGAENVDFEDKTPASPSKARTQRQSRPDTVVVDDEQSVGELEPSAYFVFIPDEIKATRLPGEDETYPTLVIIGMVLVVILNIVGIGFLAMQMLS